MIEIDFEDWRSMSLFEPQRPNGIEVLGGVGLVASALVLLPLLIGVAGLLHSLIGAVGQPAPLPPIEVMETRFVRLGREATRQLPSQPAAAVEEPTPTEAAPQPVVPEAQPTPVPASRDIGLAKQKPPKTEDLLSQLQNRADAISALSRKAEQEGNPEGIVDGTKSEGNAEDIYLGKLYDYFRRGWQVPTAISAAELQKLTCVVEVSITADGRVESFETVRPSGNDAFDASVALRMVQAEGAKLPEPPDEVAERFLGKTISLRFFGRHVR